MTIKGSASINETKLYSEKYKDFKFNPLGKTGLMVSEVGFGSYKIDIRSPFNIEALKKALLSGINLIDTSSNYTDGNSELLIGEVLPQLIDSNTISRESIVFVTKGGHVQGKNYELSQERRAEGYPFPELLEYEKGIGYCMHPEFLEDQIKRSLKRLKLETIDVYLLENPEIFLKFAQQKGLDLELARRKYYELIKKAFVFLEKEAQSGKIKHYGISSDTFVCSPEQYDFTSLEKIVSIAEEISPENHFSVIEFPMNLLEKGAISIKNQSSKMTLLELAEKKNLGVLINRPLNSCIGNKLIKLADPLIPAVPSADIIKQELENINKLEKTISEKLQSYGNSEIKEEVENNLFIFEKLEANWQEYKDTFTWEIQLNQYFLPRFHYYKNYIKNSSLKNEEIEMDLFSCTFKIGKLFSLISAYYKNEYLKFTGKIKNDLADCAPEIATAKNLSNMAIRALRSTKGVTTTLVGMTQIPYVSDAVIELKAPVNKDFDWNKINIQTD